ncbi:short-chain dehydrogenase/reductase family 9C member 7-like [Clytia hemisphaerica]|uniref:Uncharacterized protein n=1 Tax=Clytia hemisphaerica TaxID=252671 RepID=A0A7M6DLY4_9CNID
MHFVDFLEDYRLVAIFTVICTAIIWHNLKLLANVLGNSHYGKTKYVLVTGCDSGFGLAIALDLVESKCEVFAGCLTQEGVDRLEKNKDFDGFAFLMDVTKNEDVENARKFIEEKTGNDGLYAVVNNAGIQRLGRISWQSMEDLEKVMDVNFWGMARTTKAMLPLLTKTKGRIVNMSSSAGTLPFSYAGCYTISKHAIEAFSYCLMEEVVHEGISVHIIRPTGQKTNIINPEIQRKQWEDDFNKQSDDIKQRYGPNLTKYLNNLVKKINLVPEGTAQVVSKVNHAIMSSNPHITYTVGPYSWIYKILACLPVSYYQSFAYSIFPQLEPIVDRFGRR